MAMKSQNRVRSWIGISTQFIVHLTLPIHGSGTRPGGGEVRAIASESLRILLTKDDPTVAEMIADLLSGRGHRVAHAADGWAALWVGIDGGLAVALLELDLPGLDGFALASGFRRLGHASLVLVVTTRADGNVPTQAQAPGFDGFLRKPFTAYMLVEAIAAAREVQQARTRLINCAALGLLA